MGKVGEVSIAEAKNIVVARWINGRNGFWVQLRSLREENWIHVYKRSPNTFLGLLFGPNPVAVIDISSQTNWIMSVYGRKIFDQCHALAEDLARKFNTHVHAKLVQEAVGQPTQYG